MLTVLDALVEAEELLLVVFEDVRELLAIVTVACVVALEVLEVDFEVVAVLMVREDDRLLVLDVDRLLVLDVDRLVVFEDVREVDRELVFVEDLDVVFDEVLVVDADVSTVTVLLLEVLARVPTGARSTWGSNLTRS